MRILGLDPSINSPGLSLVVDDVLLIAVRLRLTAATLAIEERGARTNAVAMECASWCKCIAPGCSVDRVVYEWPQIYGVGKSKGDPNDLIALAAIGAAVARDLDMSSSEIITPLPREWQAGTKKRLTGNAWDCTRGAKLDARLTREERANVENLHDAIDAACLALHPTERALAKRRRAPNSRGSRPIAAP